MSKLLNPEDFRTFAVRGKKFVFLSGCRQILEISNPEVETYFDICVSKKDAKTLADETLHQITDSLKELSASPLLAQEEYRQNMLTLNVTHGCNMACKYCFASTVQQRKGVMPLEVAQKAICNMLESNPQEKQYTIYFFGGEPLLHKPFIKEAVAIAKEEIVSKRGKRVNFLVNTNGTLIDDEILQLFSLEKFTVTVSMDGPKALNDANRVFLNGKGSYNRIMQNIEKLRKNRINFNLRATISPRTAHLQETFRFFEELKVPYAYAFTMDGGKEENDATRFSEADLLAIDKQLCDAMAYFLEKLQQGEAVYNMDFHKNMNLLKEKKVRQYGCAAGRGSFIVDESGEYYTCQNMLPFKETAVGDVEKGIRKERLEQIRPQEVSQMAKCAQCWARYLCGGACQAERYIHQADPAYMELKCRLIQLEWEHRIRSYITMRSIY